MRRAAMSPWQGRRLLGGRSCEPDGWTLSQPQQASPATWDTPQTGMLLWCNIPGSLQQRLQSRSDLPLCPPDVLSSLCMLAWLLPELYLF